MQFSVSHLASSVVLPENGRLQLERYLRSPTRGWALDSRPGNLGQLEKRKILKRYNAYLECHPSCMARRLG